MYGFNQSHKLEVFVLITEIIKIYKNKKWPPS